MISALLLALLSAAPDEYGPLVLEADALYLAHRLLNADPRPPSSNAGDLAGSMWAATPAELDEQACDVLFEDCSRYLDEFERKAALERHRAELEALRKQNAELKSVVLGGTACLGEYDFKKRSFPVKSFFLAPAGRREPTSPPGSSPYGFAVVAKRVPQQLKVDEKLAPELVRDGRCFDLRAEVILPTKPIRWPATIRRVDPLTHIATVWPADPPDVPVDVKRVRLVSPQGLTLAVF